MTRVRLRKLIGMIALVGFVCLYALLAMGLAAIVLPSRGHAFQMAYYVVAGLAWVVPAGLIIRWMEGAGRS